MAPVCWTGSPGTTPGERLKNPLIVKPSHGLCLALLAFSPGLLLSESDNGSRQGSLTISRIVVSGNTRTRSDAIRRELLFEVGDRLDTSLVLETERSLRRLLYLGMAQISLNRTAEDTTLVEVLVEVGDLYSRALSPRLWGQLNELSYELVALDYNLLGRGQTLQASMVHNAISGNGASLFYQVSRLGRARHRLSADIGVAEEGHDIGLSFSRPFHSLSSRWSYGASASSRESLTRLYADSGLNARYRNRVEAAGLWVTHSRGQEIKVRPGFRISMSDRQFTSTGGFTYSPTDRRRVLPRLSLIVWKPKYERAQFVNMLGRVEDLQIGSWVGAGVGVSHKALGSDRNFPFLSVTLSPRFKLARSTYSFVTLTASTRYGAKGYANLFTTSQLLTYAVIRQIHTFAARLRLDMLSRPEDASQFLLGVNTGLRGYPPRGSDGTRRLLANVELRPTFYRKRHYVIAGALFIDGGTTWTRTQGFGSVRMAAGFGSRLGLPSVYNTPILRLDLARGLGTGGEWQMSFGIGQYF